MIDLTKPKTDTDNSITDYVSSAIQSFMQWGINTNALVRQVTSTISEMILGKSKKTIVNEKKTDNEEILYLAWIISKNIEGSEFSYLNKGLSRNDVLNKFNTLASENPDDPDVHWINAKLLLSSDNDHNHHKPHQELMQAYELNPINPIPLVILAESIYFRDKEKAKEYYLKVLDIMGEQKEYTFKRGQIEETIYQADIHYSLAKTYENLDNLDDALEHYVIGRHGILHSSSNKVDHLLNEARQKYQQAIDNCEDKIKKRDKDKNPQNQHINNFKSKNNQYPHKKYDLFDKFLQQATKFAEQTVSKEISSHSVIDNFMNPLGAKSADTSSSNSETCPAYSNDTLPLPSGSHHVPGLR